MSEILEVVLGLLLEFVGAILEAIVDIWFYDFSWPNTRGKRIFCGIVVLLVIGLIWWDIH